MWAPELALGGGRALWAGGRAGAQQRAGSPPGCQQREARPTPRLAWSPGGRCRGLFSARRPTPLPAASHLAPCAGRKQWGRALELWLQAVTSPTFVGSAITVRAARHLSVCSSVFVSLQLAPLLARGRLGAPASRSPRAPAGRRLRAQPPARAMRSAALRFSWPRAADLPLHTPPASTPAPALAPAAGLLQKVRAWQPHPHRWAHTACVDACTRARARACVSLSVQHARAHHPCAPPTRGVPSAPRKQPHTPATARRPTTLRHPTTATATHAPPLPGALRPLLRFTSNKVRPAAPPPPQPL